MGIFKQCVLGLYLCTYFVTAILPLNVRPRRESIRQQKAFLQPKTCFSYFFWQVLRSKAELRFGWTPMVEKWLCGNKCLKDPIFGWKVLYLYALQKNFKVAHLHEDLKKNTESQNLYLHTKISTSLLLLTNMTTPTTTNTKPNSVIHYSSLSFLIHDTMYFVSLFFLFHWRW